jgi:hypothetical protein
MVFIDAVTMRPETRNYFVYHAKNLIYHKFPPIHSLVLGLPFGN